MFKCPNKKIFNEQIKAYGGFKNKEITYFQIDVLACTKKFADSEGI